LPLLSGKRASRACEVIADPLYQPTTNFNQPRVHTRRTQGATKRPTQVSEYIQFDGNNQAISTDTTTKFQQITSNEARRTVQVRADEGAQRIYLGGDADTWREVENLKADKFQAATDIQAAPGVAGSARGALMSPIAASNLKPTDIVKLPSGMETNVVTAERLGYLRRSTTGGYENTEQGAPAPLQPAQAAPAVAPESTHTPLEADYADTANAVKHYLSPSLTARAVEELATTGQMSPDVLREASDQMNAEHEVVQSMMQKVRDGYGRQFEQHAVKAGAVPAQFTQWAQANRPDQLKLAMVAHVTRQDPRAYNALLAEFKAGRR
jgi:hypothetical protein